jgi:hypothetical protein
LYLVSLNIQQIEKKQDPANKKLFFGSIANRTIMEVAIPKDIISAKESNSAPNLPSTPSFLATLPSSESKIQDKITNRIDSFVLPKIAKLIALKPSTKDPIVNKLGIALYMCNLFLYKMRIYVNSVISFNIDLILSYSILTFRMRNRLP